ncbi:MAG: YvcK family protein [Candidatus Doudnabacteria bacterium]|nr:YvcK family protein [Candidatus Doudnabacteria bacterium]
MLIKSKNKKIVIIGGGVGAATVTKSLKDLPIKLTTIVSSFDDGGSTGMIRRDYGGWAVGDFRNCLLAASEASDELKQSLNHRFGPGQLYGAQAGNLLVKAVLNTHKPFTKANRLLHEHFKVNHMVLPISVADSKIKAQLANGNFLEGQNQVANYLSFDAAPIKSIELTKPAKILPQAARAIAEADIIIFGPGHFFTSLLPHLAVSGFADAWRKTKAKKILLLNLLAHRGQDSYYTLADYLKWFAKELGGRPFDIIISGLPPAKKILKIVSDRFVPVQITEKDLEFLSKENISHLRANLAGTNLRNQSANDTIQRAPVRHDEARLKAFLTKIIEDANILIKTNETNHN